MKLFAIRPVRGITDEYKEGIEAQIARYRAEGHEIYDPLVDTDQVDNTGLRICKDNRKAIEDADAILFMWDGKSQGSLFDLGMAFALRKPVIPVIGYVPAMTDHKLYQNMVFAWQENGAED